MRIQIYPSSGPAYEVEGMYWEVEPAGALTVWDSEGRWKLLSVRDWQVVRQLNDGDES